MPTLSVLVPTYARVEKLQEMLFCLFSQDVKTSFEIVILNDCEEQDLRIQNFPLLPESPVVRIINTKRFRSLGDKRNALIEEARGDWILWADDDDFCQPWYLSRFFTALEDNTLYVAGEGSAGCHCGIQNEVKQSWWPIEMMVRRDIALKHRFEPVSYHEDTPWKELLERTYVNNISRTFLTPAYIYRWDSDVWHISGGHDKGEARNVSDFRRNAQERMDCGLEPSGIISISPKKTHNWPFLLSGIIKTDQPSGKYHVKSLSGTFDIIFNGMKAEKIVNGSKVMDGMVKIDNYCDILWNNGRRDRIQFKGQKGVGFSGYGESMYLKAF